MSLQDKEKCRDCGHPRYFHTGTHVKGSKSACRRRVLVARSPVLCDCTAFKLPTVIKMTREEALRRREELIAQTGLDEETLRSRGEMFQLYPEHQLIWETIRGFDYLLKEGDHD